MVCAACALRSREWGMGKGAESGRAEDRYCYHYYRWGGGEERTGGGGWRITRMVARTASTAGKRSASMNGRGSGVHAVGHPTLYSPHVLLPPATADAANNRCIARTSRCPCSTPRCMAHARGCCCTPRRIND